MFGQHLGCDEPYLRQDAHLFGDVSQLSHISRPLVGLHHHLRLWGQPDGFGDIVFLGRIQCELLEEEHHIRFAVPQRRHLYVDGAQSVIEVFTELPLSDGMGDIHISGCHYSCIGLTWFTTSHTYVFSCLQYTQESGLCAHGQFAHFVQEECASVGSTEVTFMLSYGTGESTFLVTKQFAVNGTFGYGTAVDGYVAFSLAPTMVMYDAWYDLLAHATLSLYEHREICGSHL